MVAESFYGDGRNTALAVDFGAVGLCVYDGLLHSWSQISSRSPDDS